MLIGNWIENVTIFLAWAVLLTSTFVPTLNTDMNLTSSYTSIVALGFPAKQVKPVDWSAQDNHGLIPFRGWVRLKFSLPSTQILFTFFLRWKKTVPPLYQKLKENPWEVWKGCKGFICFIQNTHCGSLRWTQISLSTSTSKTATSSSGWFLDSSSLHSWWWEGGIAITSQGCLPNWGPTPTSPLLKG